MKIATIIAASVLAASGVDAGADCQVVRNRVTVGDYPSSFMYDFTTTATDVEDIKVSTVPFPSLPPKLTHIRREKDGGG